MSTRVLRTTFIVTDTLRKRFLAKTIEASSGCMIWTGAVQRNSYGAFKIGHEKIDAHVASWRIANGGQPVPLNQLVMHKCDCRMCVNPEHLKLGTASQNMLDAHKNGRGEDFKIQGEHHCGAILTDEMVQRIRSEYVPYKRSFNQMAREIGVSESCVRLAYHRKSWKHVPVGECN